MSRRKRELIKLVNQLTVRGEDYDTMSKKIAVNSEGKRYQQDKAEYYAGFASGMAYAAARLRMYVDEMR